MSRTKFILLIFLAIALAPVSAYLLKEGYRFTVARFNCPVVYMTYPDIVHKVVNSDGEEIFPKSLDDLKYGYDVIWVGYDYGGHEPPRVSND